MKIERKLQETETYPAGTLIGEKMVYKIPFG